MKRMIAFLAVCGLIFAVQPDVFAGSGCCGGGAKDTAKETKKETSDDTAKKSCCTSDKSCKCG